MVRKTAETYSKNAHLQICVICFSELSSCEMVTVKGYVEGPPLTIDILVAIMIVVKCLTITKKTHKEQSCQSKFFPLIRWIQILVVEDIHYSMH